MARDDSLLNTGFSSAASRKLEQKRKLLQEDKRTVKHKLQPGAEIILQWIAEEREKTVNLEKMIINIESEERVMAQLLARKMHLDFLAGLKVKAESALSMMPEKPKTEVSNA